MKKHEYNQLFDSATDEFEKLLCSEAHQKEMQEHLNVFKDEHGNMSMESIVVFAQNESMNQMKDYLYILLQKFFDVE